MELLFKEGDRVRIRETRCVDNFNASMTEYLGRVVTITLAFYGGSDDRPMYRILEDSECWVWEQDQIASSINALCFSSELLKILKKWDKDKTNKILAFYYENESDIQMNYFDVALEDATKISYITQARMNLFEGSYYNADKRRSYAYMAKIGKTLTKIANDVGIDITIKDIERLQALFIAQLTLKFEIVSGEDIRKYYHYTQYCACTETDSLGCSCMRGEEQQEYFDFYVDHLKMLILKCNECDKVIGRALIWEGIINEITLEKVTFMDRIYGNNQTINIFKNYAESKKWIFKKNQSYSDHSLQKINREDDSFTLPLFYRSNKKHHYYATFPYLDTMRYYYLEDGYFCLRNYTCEETKRNGKKGRSLYCLDFTDGIYREEDRDDYDNEDEMMEEEEYNEDEE